MKLVGEDVSLPACNRVYELDVRYNEALRLEMDVHLLSLGKPKFMNGDEVIGYVGFDNVFGVTSVMIYPEIES